MTRCVVLTHARAAGATCASPPFVAELARRHAELIVAIDGHAEQAEPPPLRWARVRTALRDLPNTWTTLLADTPTLASPSDRMAALTSRLGRIDQLWLEDASLVPLAQKVGLDARHACAPDQSASAPGLAELAPDVSRALVVLRAQPFHRGHLALVEHALSLAQEAVVVIAAAERAYSERDPFTAGERLSLVRAGLGALAAHVWLLALPAPPWPAMALPQLAFVAPPCQRVVTHNAILAALAREQGLTVAGLPQPFCLDGAALTATRVRARLVHEGAGPWLADWLPSGSAALLAGTPSLAERCAVIAAAGS